MKNYDNNPNSIMRKNAKIITDIKYLDTVIKETQLNFSRVVLICHKVWLQDENGKIRETKPGDNYKANIINGVLSFNKPLKFDSNEK